MSAVQRILVVRVGAMGDVLHALPGVAALRRLWPEAVIDWVVDPRWAPLLVGAGGRGPAVSKVHLAETRTWTRAPASLGTVQSLLGLRRTLRAAEYATVVDVQGTLRSAVIGRFAGGRGLVGFVDPREGAARWLYRRPFGRRGTHVVEQNAALLGEALGVALEPLVPELPVRPEAEAWAAGTVQSLGRGRPLALLAPTAGWGAKEWPAERFAALAQALDAAGWAVLVNCAFNGDPVCAAVVEGSGNTAKGAWSDVAGLIELVRRVQLVAGGDTGPVHLAAALGVPLVALFGPTDPARNGPWGPGPRRVLRDAASVTSYKHVAGPDVGLLRIGVDEVMAAVREVVG